MGSKFGATGDGLVKDWTQPPARMPEFWSYTRWSAFSKCKLFYLLAYCHKVKQEKGYHLERGIDIHNKAEAFLKGTVRGLPRELAEFRKPFAAIKKLGARSEFPITLTKTFTTCEATDWGNAWLRMKMDAALIEEEAAHGDFIDFKTGKNRNEYEEQEEIFALGCFSMFPKLKTIGTEYWFLDHGDVVDNSFTRDVYPALKKKWKANSKKMLGCKKFVAEPSKNACMYCPFRSDKKLTNGEPGMCEEWQKAT